MLPAVRARKCECGEVGEVELSYVQDPLLRHAGYGAAERKSVTLCAGCLKVRVQSVSAVAPRR